jgi:hypothetical protein
MSKHNDMKAIGKYLDEQLEKAKRPKHQEGFDLLHDIAKQFLDLAVSRKLKVQMASKEDVHGDLSWLFYYDGCPREFAEIFYTPKHYSFSVYDHVHSVCELADAKLEDKKEIALLMLQHMCDLLVGQVHPQA